MTSLRRHITMATTLRQFITPNSKLHCEEKPERLISEYIETANLRVSC